MACKSAIRTRLYRAWHNMRSRCNNPSREEYSHYGAEGISVCPRWDRSFAEFLKDMAPTYQLGLVLDRISNDRGYEPANCRWSTPEVSSQNRRTTQRIEVDGVLGETNPEKLSRALDLSGSTVRRRLAAGWRVAVTMMPPDASPAS